MVAHADALTVGERHERRARMASPAIERPAR
jgi:hypothetical protein